MPPKRKRAAKESASGDAPIGGRNNGCYRAQQVIFDDLVTPHAPYTVQTTQAVPTPSPEEKSSRLRSQEMKLDVLQQYTAWIAAGKPYGQSPATALKHKYGCTLNYPKRLFNRMLERGTLQNGKSTGRPPEYDEDFWERMCEIVDEFQAKNMRTATHADLNAEFIAAGYEQVPCRETLRKAKKEAGFVTKKKAEKPLLNTAAKEARHEFAIEHRDQDFERIVVIDQKWFCEGKTKMALQYQERPDHPIPRELKFIPKKAETKTQEKKIMVLCAVSENTTISMYEMVKKDYTKCRTQSGSLAKGITTEYLAPFFKKIKRTAQTKLGPGDIGIWLDNATVHKACKPLLEKLFQPVVFQPPLSPDTNLCDAGVFVNMANMANNEEPNTQEGIRKAAKKAWNKITPAHLKKVSNRVRDNMKMIEKLEGGNWYIEGQK